MRLTWIDAMKGLAMIGVVFGHVEQGYCESGLFPAQNPILQAMWDFGHSFRMPLFFLLSGYLYEMTWNERGAVSWDKIKNKFLDIGLLYMLFASLYWVVKFGASLLSHNILMVHAVTIWDLILIPVKPFNYLWFLWVLAFLFFTVPCLVKVGWKQARILGLFTLGYLLPWGEIISWGGVTGTISQFFYGGFYFVLGSYLRLNHFEIVGMRIKKWILPAAVLICAGNSYMYLHLGKSIWNSTAHEGIVALAACYIIWYVFAAYWDKRNWIGNRFCKLCGEKSLQIYLLHMYLVSSFRTIFHKIGIENLSVLIAISTVTAVLVPLGVAYLCEKNPKLDYIFHPADFLRKYHFL